MERVEMARAASAGVAAALLLAASAFAGQQDDGEVVRIRQRISLMESVLEQAVSNGADNLLRDARAIAAEAPRFTGAPEVRGFHLDDYGFFFDVEVPGLSMPVTWPLQYFEIVRSNRDLGQVTAELKALVTQMDDPDPRLRERLARAVERLESQVREPVTFSSRPVGRLSGEVASAVAVDPALLADPYQRYTAAVRLALVDAMLENSGSLALAEDEWFTVAARDNLPANPLVPGDATSFRTLILRVKGGDLVRFRAGELSLERAREQVDVSER